MLGRIVKRERLIIVRSALRDFSRVQRGRAHEAMPDQARYRCPLLLGQPHQLRRKLARYVTPFNAMKFASRDPEAVENRKQQQRVFRRLSQRLYPLVNARACSIAAFASGAA